MIYTLSSPSTDSTEVSTTMSTTNNNNSDDTKLEFPSKLFQMLEAAETSSDDREIVSWLPCGRAFQVHNRAKFAEKLMPAYFASKIYKSFHRSLNLWGFETVRLGPNKGAIYHPYFVRSYPELCRRMKRTKLKNHHRVPMKTMTTVMTAPQQTEIPRTVIRYAESFPTDPVTPPSRPAVSVVQEEQQPPRMSSRSNPLLPPTLNPALLAHLLRLSNGWTTPHAATTTFFQESHPTPSLQPSVLEQQLQQQLLQHNPYNGMLAGGRDPMLLAAALQVLSDVLTRQN